MSLRTDGYDDWMAAAHVDVARAERCVSRAEVPAGTTLRYRVRVGTGGELVGVAPAGDAHRDFDRCVRRALSAVQWSPPPGGGRGTVTVAYRLR
ncbi:MAG TPA: hypothetical protein RMH99_02640 [Sandaracinaceae bacterium LLY-WYZ-13_1]|nr:hypothetical protein [Sandaracinaceae bacterium LLY-WYZ-13_1]